MGVGKARRTVVDSVVGENTLGSLSWRSINRCFPRLSPVVLSTGNACFRNFLYAFCADLMEFVYLRDRRNDTHGRTTAAVKCARRCPHTHICYVYGLPGSCCIFNFYPREGPALWCKLPNIISPYAYTWCHVLYSDNLKLYRDFDCGNVDRVENSTMVCALLLLCGIPTGKNICNVESHDRLLFPIQTMMI